MHEYEYSLPFALLVPMDKRGRPAGIVNIPLYSSKDRRITEDESSFLCSVPVMSDLTQNALLKKGIMLAIDHSDLKSAK